ncbi:MAG: dUTP diphosphatase [Spirochaetales bacterium]|nr:dUTP diphosphatase [Spirochaetales bacterium]
MIECKCVVKGEVPHYATDGSAGADLKANIEESIRIEPGQRVLVPTGLFIEIPHGYEAQIRPRSGLALKKGITVLNSPGTIDSDYRGEIKVILINLGNEAVEIHPHDRIAQIIFAQVVQAKFLIHDKIALTQRGEGGFGSTG